MLGAFERFRLGEKDAARIDLALAYAADLKHPHLDWNPVSAPGGEIGGGEYPLAQVAQLDRAIDVALPGLEPIRPPGAHLCGTANGDGRARARIPFDVGMGVAPARISRPEREDSVGVRGWTKLLDALTHGGDHVFAVVAGEELAHDLHALLRH